MKCQIVEYRFFPIFVELEWTVHFLGWNFWNLIFRNKFLFRSPTFQKRAHWRVRDTAVGKIIMVIYSFESGAASEWRWQWLMKFVGIFRKLETARSKFLYRNRVTRNFHGGKVFDIQLLYEALCNWNTTRNRYTFPLFLRILFFFQKATYILSLW